MTFIQRQFNGRLSVRRDSAMLVVYLEVVNAGLLRFAGKAAGERDWLTVQP